MMLSHRNEPKECRSDMKERKNKDQSMKTILLAPTPPPYGGIAEWTRRMLHSSLKNGWKLELVDEKVSKRRGAYSTKRYFFEEAGRCLRIWSNLNKKLKDPEAVVVHCCIPATTFAMLRECGSVWITKLHKKKFILHFRCTVPNMAQGGVWKLVLQKLCNKSDAIIILNRQSEKFLQSLTKTKRVMVPNFVGYEEMNCWKNYVVREKIKKIVYVGGVMASKGCDDIVHVAKAFPEVTFELIGKVDPSIAALAAAADVTNVLLPGTMPHEQVMQELISSDVFIFLSRYDGEGFSNALAEAMAVGLPCVVTDWAANADMIEERGGIVVPINDPEGAIRGVKAMLSYHVRKQMSEWNQKKVKKCYSAKRITEIYVNIYETQRGNGD